MISDPITLPSRSIRLPFACLWNRVCASPVTASGYRMPVRMVSTNVIRIAGLSSFHMSKLLVVKPLSVNRLSQVQQAKQSIDRPDAREGHENSADPLTQQIAPQQRPSRKRPVLHPAQCQRHERNDNQGVENHS